MLKPEGRRLAVYSTVYWLLILPATALGTAAAKGIQNFEVAIIQGFARFHLYKVLKTGTPDTHI